MKFYILIFWILVTSYSFGQEEITWTASYNQKDSKVAITASLAEGWHVYSMYVDEMAGPIATKIVLIENPRVKISGKIMEPKPIAAYDKNFEAELLYFEKTVTFEQQLECQDSTHLAYLVTYMICNDYMCYPPVDKEINIEIAKK